MTTTGTLVTSRGYTLASTSTYSPDIIKSIEILERGQFTLTGELGVAAVGQCWHDYVGGVFQQDAYFIKTHAFTNLPTPCHVYTGPELMTRDVTRQELASVKSKPDVSHEDDITATEYENIVTICYSYYYPGPIKEGAGMFDYRGESAVDVAPNPVRSGEVALLTVDLPPGDRGILEFSVMDMIGNTVYRGTQEVAGNKQTVLLNIPRLPVGVYMVNLVYQQQAYHVKLMVSE